MARHIFSMILMTAVAVELPAQVRHSMKDIWAAGLPHITSYTSQDYKASLQNWSVVQDNEGMIYVGNSSGLLQYDGVRWRLIKTPQSAPVKSLAKDGSGRIYVGGVGELGYLEPDLSTGMKFHTLLPELDSASRRFSDLWFTYSLRDTIYFLGDTHILRWANNSFKVWKGLNIGFSWIVRDQLYVHLRGDGLKRMAGDSIVSVTDGSDLFKEKAVTALLPHGDHEFLAVTNVNECYIFGTQGVRAAPTRIPKGFVYNWVRLLDGTYLLATLNGGVYLLDAKGNITKHFTKRDGLITDTIIGAYVDGEGDVWLAGDNGIMRVEMNSPLRVYDGHLGIDEDIDDITLFNNELFVATISGLYKLGDDSGDDARRSFRKVPGVDFQTFNLHPVGDHLFISNYYGLYTLDQQNTISRLVQDNVQITEYPSMDTTYMLFGNATGEIGELIREGTSWKVGSRAIKLEGRPYAISQLKNGNIFIGTRYNGVYELRFAENEHSFTLGDNYSLIHYDTLCGLPALTLGPLSTVGSSVYVPTIEKGLFKFDTASETFKPDAAIMDFLPDHSNVMVGSIEEEDDGRFWLPVYDDYETSLYHFAAGRLETADVSGRLANQFIETIDDNGEGILFLGSDKGLVVYDRSKDHAGANAFATALRRITTNKDSILYSGHLPAVRREFRLGFEYNNLSFEFSLPSYDLPQQNRYQYFLEGFDDNWSAWGEQNRMDFTNLPEGDYVFHVRGKNIYGQIAEEASFAFSIDPPLQRTWWAYVLYVGFLSAFVVFVVQWRSAQLSKDKVLLERIISERTAEITVQSEKLKEMDRTKSRFYANISHEFRTPLTLILGPLEEELKIRASSEREPLRLVRRSALRLLELVNQLLDLSKLDAGKMELHVGPHNLVRFLNVLAASFGSWAEHKKIHFIRNIYVSDDTFWYDQDKVEKIITNLLANAFKFTPSGGTVLLDVASRSTGDDAELIITIADTGQGIPPEEQDQIFSPFYQTKQGQEDQEPGTGLGLSLVKELAELHKGHVSLKSTVNEGTTFVVIIPVSRHIYATEELDAISSNTQPVESQLSYEREVDDLPETPELETADEKDTIVVVEDNTDLRSFITSVLQQDYKVFGARNGEEGVDLIVEKLPNLVLTDLMMPRLDGMQLTERLKADQRTSHIPVILLTAKNESNSRIQGLQLGADDYLTKPFSSDELLVRIANLIDQRKRLSVLFRERILVTPTPTQQISIDEKFLLKVRDLVESQMADTTLSVDRLADTMFMSRTQLLRKLKALTGLSPNEFIKDIRLKRAAELIRQKADSITQIGYKVGFNDQSYFTKCFKKQFGVTPTEFSQSVEIH